jgi:hypothetical protein
MTKSMQIYYNTIFGAIGGLLTWLVIGLIPTGAWPVNIANAFVGAGIGVILGGILGFVDGALLKTSVRRAMTGAASTGAIGFFGGAAGLFLGGLIFVVLQGGLIPRMIGWMLLGLALGLGQSVISRQLKRISYSALGGTVAGLIGGLLYELFTHVFINQSGQAQVYLSALGLIAHRSLFGIHHSDHVGNRPRRNDHHSEWTPGEYGVLHHWANSVRDLPMHVKFTSRIIP